MGPLLSFAAYLVTAVFAWRVAWRLLLLWRRPGPPDARGVAGRMGPLGGAKALLDILLLGRLFRANPRLWFGEWVFHLTFLLVAAVHLRFFLQPVPAWVAWLQPAGPFLGYVFTGSLFYILSIRLAVEKANYISVYNFFLLLAAFSIGATGLIMSKVARADLAGIKLFTLGLLSFRPAAAPEEAVFILHFALALLFIAFIPSHIFTAPLTILEARRREETLSRVMHDGEER